MEWEEIPDNETQFVFNLMQELNYKAYSLNQCGKPLIQLDDWIISMIPRRRTNILVLPSNIAFDQDLILDYIV